MRVFLYILRFDSGFAPNPFHGWCTLACCKPAIRRKAQPGDWIVGITPRGDGNRVAYAMRVDASLTFEQYWSDSRFKAKIPRWQSGTPVVERCGDNCYEPLGGDTFRQLPSQHWKHENSREIERQDAEDLRGERVVVGLRFCYFGTAAIEFPERISIQLPARFNRVNFTDQEKSVLVPFLERLPQGIQGHPRQWPKDDASWRQETARCG